MDRRLTALLAIGSLLALALAFAAGASAGPSIANHRALKRVNPAVVSDSAGGSLIAPAAACPQQENLDVSLAAQQQAMRCMTNFARVHAGLSPLSDSTQLDLSAQEKTADVLGCDSFSHEACGREFAYWIQRTGYMSASCWHVGENLAWGSGDYGTVRSIFRAWMQSAEHRRNILGDYTDLGVDLASGELEGRPGARVWTEQFGSHCEAAS
jgi:uncharacterized protein YkwD